MMDIAEQCRKAKEYNLFDANVYEQAADEIERLRKRVKLLEGYLNGALHVVENFVHCDTTEARKALVEKE